MPFLFRTMVSHAFPFAVWIKRQKQISLADIPVYKVPYIAR